MFETPGKTITLQTKKLKIMKNLFKKIALISLIALPLATITYKAVAQTQTPKNVCMFHGTCLSCGNCVAWCDYLVFNKYSHPVHKVTYSNEFRLTDDRQLTDLYDAIQWCPTQSIFI